MKEAAWELLWSRIEGLGELDITELPQVLRDVLNAHAVILGLLPDLTTARELDDVLLSMQRPTPSSTATEKT